jgi:hypothetical protein
VGDLPLWLDEGLAEYFEGPGDRHGLNPDHLSRLPDDLKTGWRPDLARLETLVDLKEVSPRDYRESWAWVHYLLNQQGADKAALLAYLSDLHKEPKATPLSRRLKQGEPSTEPHTNQRMLSHLERIRSSPPADQAVTPVAGTPVNRDRRILLQDSSIETEPPRRTSQRRSLLGRLIALFGSSDGAEEPVLPNARVGAE